jgi:hypothetical protein
MKTKIGEPIFQVSSEVVLDIIIDKLKNNNALLSYYNLFRIHQFIC